MPYLILGLVLLGALLFAARLIVKADPAKIAPYLGWFVAGIALAGGIAILAALIASERLGSAFFVASGLGWAAWRGRAFWRYLASNRARTSEVETEMLLMRLDLDTGAMTGQVRRGSFAGKRLQDLGQAELIALWRQCIAADEAGARLIETYLDRRYPGWRQGTREEPAAAATGDIMTREQAFAILDLEPGASPEQIKEAHRRLMMKLHPDHGGSTFLASQINRAKEVLTGE
jgi:DnaJ-domain-containing protein 1